MGFIDKFMSFFPEITEPKKRLTLKNRLMFTLLVLAIYFVLGSIPLAGLDQSVLGNFEFLSMMMGARIGTLLTLGIGPLVTGSIILQLLVGAGLIKVDTTSKEGKKKYHAIQKFMGLAFVLIEAFVFVFLGGLTAQGGLVSLKWLLVGQLILGGVIIMLLDGMSSKWGIGSGISLFIAAGISLQLMIQLFSPFAADGTLFFISNLPPIGAIPALFAYLSPGFQAANVGKEIIKILIGLISTTVIFLLSIYFQSMKVELNLAPKNSRGFHYPWPLSFLYTSNIPVILTAAFLANMQLVASFTSANGWFSTFVNGWLSSPSLTTSIIQNGFQWILIAKSLVYLIIVLALATLFSTLWVQTSGLDSKSQAKNILGMGLTIPGYRSNQSVLIRILDRYIPYLAVLGGITIGLLSAFADLLGSLVGGTGLLLTVMIIYNFYQNMVKQYSQEMSPELRKFMKG